MSEFWPIATIVTEYRQAAHDLKLKARESFEAILKILRESDYIWIYCTGIQVHPKPVDGWLLVKPSEDPATTPLVDCVVDLDDLVWQHELGNPENDVWPSAMGGPLPYFGPQLASLHTRRVLLFTGSQDFGAKFLIEQGWKVAGASERLRAYYESERASARYSMKSAQQRLAEVEAKLAALPAEVPHE